MPWLLVPPGPCLNIKTVFPRYGDSHVCSKTCLATVLIRSIFAREKLHERFSASAVFPAQNLCDLFNTCVISSCFPSQMKLADITPLFKKDDTLCKENYRSVNLLITVSKVFERILCDQLNEFFEKVLRTFLSAYRKGHNCQHFVLRLTEHWRQALDNGHISGTVAMDLSKAFDWMPHALLIAKLHAYGLSDDACNMVISYLKDRHQGPVSI